MESKGLKINRCSNGFNICVFKRLLTAIEYMCQYYIKWIKPFKRKEKSQSFASALRGKIIQVLLVRTLTIQLTIPKLWIVSQRMRGPASSADNISMKLAPPETLK